MLGIFSEMREESFEMKIYGEEEEDLNTETLLSLSTPTKERATFSATKSTTKSSPFIFRHLNRTASYYIS